MRHPLVLAFLIVAVLAPASAGSAAGEPGPTTTAEPNVWRYDSQGNVAVRISISVEPGTDVQLVQRWNVTGLDGVLARLMVERSSTGMLGVDRVVQVTGGEPRASLRLEETAVSVPPLPIESAWTARTSWSYNPELVEVVFGWSQAVLSSTYEVTLEDPAGSVRFEATDAVSFLTLDDFSHSEISADARVGGVGVAYADDASVELHVAENLLGMSGWIEGFAVTAKDGEFSLVPPDGQKSSAVDRAYVDDAPGVYRFRYSDTSAGAVPRTPFILFADFPRAS